ncbi:MAG: hypothetical protein ACXWJW_02760 [Xanthobacteraceae bacterium]
MDQYTEWRKCEALFFSKLLIDGTSATGPLMRRKVDGKWQYRKLTPDEESERLADVAW